MRDEDEVVELDAQVTTWIGTIPYSSPLRVRLTWTPALPPQVALRVAPNDAVTWELDRVLLRDGLATGPAFPAGVGRVAVWSEGRTVRVRLAHRTSSSVVALPRADVHAFLARTRGCIGLDAGSGVDWDTEIAALLAGGGARE